MFVYFQLMDDVWPVKICQIEQYLGQRGTETQVIEATEFKFDIRFNL